jgi:hypothetical protein
MNDTTRLLITIALVPVVWMLLEFLVFRPLGKLAHKHLPKNIADALTKKRFEG